MNKDFQSSTPTTASSRASNLVGSSQQRDVNAARCGISLNDLLCSFPSCLVETQDIHEHNCIIVG